MIVLYNYFCTTLTPCRLLSALFAAGGLFYIVVGCAASMVFGNMKYVC